MEKVTSYQRKILRINVLEKAFAAKGRPEGGPEYMALQKALEEYQAVTGGIDAAIEKALLQPNRQLDATTLAGAVAKNLGSAEHDVDGKRLNHDYPTGQRDIFRGSAAS